jgi:hypothetical protein
LLEVLVQQFLLVSATNGTSTIVVPDFGEQVAVHIESLSKKITVEPKNLQLDSALVNGTLVEFS